MFYKKTATKSFRSTKNVSKEVKKTRFQKKCYLCISHTKIKKKQLDNN